MKNRTNLLCLLSSLLLASCGAQTSSEVISENKESFSVIESVSEEESTSLSEQTTESESEEETVDITKYINQLTEADQSYLSETSNKGEIVDFSYYYNNAYKTAKVYLPFCYELMENLDVFYLIHSMGGDEMTFLNYNINIVLDNLIEKGEIKPMVVVMPTWNVEGKTVDETSIYTDFPDEIATLIPLIEQEYKVSNEREHRICGGYSMGGITTWSVFVRHFDLFKTYINMSGYLWEVSKLNSDAVEKKNLALLESTLDAATDKDFTLLNYVGSDDFVYSYLMPLLEKCSSSSYFDFKSNTTINVLSGAAHNTSYANGYLIHALKYLYQNMQ